MPQNSWKAAGIFTMVAAMAGFVAFTSSGRPSPQAGKSGYQLANKVVLGGDGTWDYLEVDPATHHLFISRSSHVMVVDPAQGKAIGDIPNTQGVHGIAIADEFNRGFTSNGTTGTSTIFDLKTLQPVGEAKTDPGPDGIIYDPGSKRVFTLNGRSNSATAIDAKTGMVAGSVALGGRPEFAAADGKGHVFVNLEDKSSIVEVDSNALKVLNTWSLAPCDSPSGLAIDAKNERLFAGCDNKMMAVVDGNSGKVITTLPIGMGVDANRFDPATGFAFASSGDGTITVAHEDTPDKFTIVDTVKTADRARTMAIDYGTHDVYTVTAQFEAPPPAPPAAEGQGQGAAPAARAGGFRRATMVPNTFTLLIFKR